MIEIITNKKIITVVDSLEKKKTCMVGPHSKVRRKKFVKKYIKWIPPENRERGRPRRLWIRGLDTRWVKYV